MPDFVTALKENGKDDDDRTWQLALDEVLGSFKRVAGWSHPRSCYYRVTNVDPVLTDFLSKALRVKPTLGCTIHAKGKDDATFWSAIAHALASINENWLLIDSTNVVLGARRQTKLLLSDRDDLIDSSLWLEKAVDRLSALSPDVVTQAAFESALR